LLLQFAAAASGCHLDYVVAPVVAVVITVQHDNDDCRAMTTIQMMVMIMMTMACLL